MRLQVSALYVARQLAVDAAPGWVRLRLSRAKPAETPVEARRNTGVQMVSRTWV